MKKDNTIITAIKFVVIMFLMVGLVAFVSAQDEAVVPEDDVDVGVMIARVEARLIVVRDKIQELRQFEAEQTGLLHTHATLTYLKGEMEKAEAAKAAEAEDDKKGKKGKK